MIYRYRAIDEKTGSSTRGTIEAENLKEALDMLRIRGLRMTFMQPVVNLKDILPKFSLMEYLVALALIAFLLALLLGSLE